MQLLTIDAGDSLPPLQCWTWQSACDLDIAHKKQRDCDSICLSAKTLVATGQHGRSLDDNEVKTQTSLSSHLKQATFSSIIHPQS